MATKKKLITIGILVTAIIIAIALIAGICICYLIFKDRHYESSAGDAKLIVNADRGIFCSSYSVQASTDPEIGTNTNPSFSLFQGKQSDIKLRETQSTRTLRGSEAFGERPEDRMIYQSLHLNKGAYVKGKVCSSQFVPDDGLRPGLYIAATTDKSQLSQISDNILNNNTDIKCDGCLFHKLYSNLKECNLVISCGQPNCWQFNQFSFTVPKESDYFIGYIYVPKTKTVEENKEPAWAELRIAHFFVNQTQYNPKANGTSWIMLSSGTTEAQVQNFSNSDSLFVKFSKPLHNLHLPLGNIDIVYRCHATIWLYLVLFLVIPLVIIGVVWAVIYYLIRRSQTGSGLLSSEDE